MRQTEQFTSFEGFSLMSVSFLFHVFSGSLPQLSKFCGTASWISVALGMVFALVLFLLYYLLFRLYEGKTLLEITQLIFGRTVGKALNFYLFLYFLCYCINNLVEAISILAMNTYAHTRSIYLAAAILAVVYVIAIYPIKGMARTASVAVPLFLASITFILVMSVSQYDVGYLFPILGYGWKPILQTGFFHMTNYDGILVAAVFMGSYRSSTVFRKNGILAILICGASFFFSTLFYSMANPYQTSIFNTAGLLDLAQSIYISRFFQRFESVFIIFVSMGKILVICVGMLATRESFSSVFALPQPQRKRAVLPLLLIVLTCNQVLYNLPRLRLAFSDFMRYSSLYFTLGFLLLLLVGALVRRWGGGKRRLRAVSAMLVCCLLVPMLSGCGDSISEPDEEIFAVVMGYDRSDSETLRVTMKLMPEDKKSAGGSGGGEFADSEGSIDFNTIPGNVFIVDAPCNIPAADLINTVIPKHLSLLHVKMLVISEELAREDLDMLITPIIRYNEIKSTIGLIIVEGSAQDYITSKSSELIPFLPLETEMILKQQKGNASYMVRTMGEVYNDFSSNYGDAVVMYGGLNKNNNKMDADENLYEGHIDENAAQKGPKEEESQDGAASENKQDPGDGTSASQSDNQQQGEEEGGGEQSGQQEESGGGDEEDSAALDDEARIDNGSGMIAGQNNRINMMNEEFGLHPDRQKQNSASAEGGQDVPSVFYDNPTVGYLNGYLPGEIPIQTSVEQQLAGMAVLKDNRMVGTLNTHETRLFMLADGSFTGAVLTVRDPYKPDFYVIFYARNRQNNKVRVTMDDDGVAHIDITAYIQAELAIVQNTEPNYQDTEEGEMLKEYTKNYLEQEIAKLIDKVQHEYHSDILRLGRYVAPKFSTIQEWEAYDWPTRYRDAEITVTVDMRL